MRIRVALLALSLVLVGAGKNKKKKKPKRGQEPVEEPADAGPTFVDISFDDDDEDFFGSELMMATAECGDLIKMEPAAMMGKLNDGEIRCLDDKLIESEKQTFKDKLSRVLMSDAWAKGDKHRWEAVVRRHLTDIDRSDPNLCYKFSVHLSRKDAEFADETMRWVDVALDNRSQWTGDIHVKRVYALYKIKTVAAQKKWMFLEDEYARKQEPALLEGVKEARNATKTYAREWLEYAQVAKKDDTVARQLCVSAAGTASFCEENL
jgi:hypothetical protein